MSKSRGLKTPTLDLAERARIFKALSDPTRLQILEALRDGQEHSGKEIADTVGITLALLCHHTGCLEEAGVLKKRKHGQTCFHRLEETALHACLSSLLESR